jgi:hypothetical protein
MVANGATYTVRVPGSSPAHKSSTHVGRSVHYVALPALGDDMGRPAVPLMTPRPNRRQDLSMRAIIES